MKLTRQDAITLFEGLGFASANGWKKARFQGRLAKFSETVDPDKELASADAQLIFDRVLNAIDAGEAIELTAPASTEKVEAPEEVTTHDPREEAAPKKKKKSTKKKASKVVGDPTPKKKKKASTKKSDTAPKEKIKRERKGGMLRPLPDSVGGKVWAVCDRMTKKGTKMVDRKKVIEKSIGSGLSRSSTLQETGHYYKWFKDTMR